MKVLKRTARCPRCGRSLMNTGKVPMGKHRVLFEYLHKDRHFKRCYEVVWVKYVELYEHGVYGRLWRKERIGK